MKVKITISLFALLLFTVCKSMLFAGTTGKIAGAVTDANTGEALIGANIMIKGTAIGAASDIDGNYSIINVPPGVYTIVVSMIGYQKMEFENVRVSIDLTTRIDINLTSTSVEMETLVVAAERPMVVKDMTSSMSTTTAEQIQNLPVQNVQQVLRLSAGIIEDNGRLHIRGGRPGEVAYWVDGVAATDVYNGTIGITVENSAVQELQVISGTFNAEYGQAMSGIVNIITKEGASDYSGQIKLYGGDYISNDDIYSSYKKLQVQENPENGLTQIISSEREYPLKKINPILNGEFSLSGPVPLIGNDLTFFANGRYFSDEGYYYGINWFKPNGNPGDSSVVAMNPLVTNSIQGKLSYKFGSDIKLSYNIFWNKSKRERNYFNGNITTHDYKYVPYGLPQLNSEGFTHMLALNHVLSSNTFYELRVTRFRTETKQYAYENPYQSVKYLARVAADTAEGIEAETFDPFTEEGKAKLQAYAARNIKPEYFIDPNSPDGYIDPDDIVIPTANSFMNQGMDLNHFKRSTAYWIAKLDVTSQASKKHQLKFGAEFRFHELTLNSFTIIPKVNDDGSPMNYFLPDIPQVGNINRNDYNRKPREFSAYIQDKIEFNDIIVNLGLRFDYFDANSVIPADPTDPNIYLPFKYGNIYAGVADSLKNLAQGYDQLMEDQLAAGLIREYTVEERKAFMHKAVSSKSALSPRLGIAFPITDRGVIHFSYGHFFQIPEFQYLYSSPDFKLSGSSSNALLENADLKPQKTVMYEIGLQQQIADDIGVDLTLFYRDVRDWVGTSPLIKTARTSVEYSRYENKDYSNVRGITLKIDKRFTNNYSFRADYTFQKAEGTYSDPDDAYNAIANEESPVLSLLPMNWDQTHTFNAQFIYTISDWTFSLIGRYWSGQPYTPVFPQGETVGGSTVSGLTINSERLPDQKSVDLTINKSFRLGSSIHLDVFVNVYNLLDQRDETQVRPDTGTADYTTTIDPSEIPFHENRISTVEDFITQPSWYTGPRQVQLGVQFGF